MGPLKQVVVVQNTLMTVPKWLLASPWSKLVLLIFSRIKKWSALVFSCNEVYDMPKFSEYCNSDFHKVSNVTDTDNSNMPKISQLSKVTKNDYYFAWFWKKPRDLISRLKKTSLKLLKFLRASKNLHRAPLPTFKDAF